MTETEETVLVSRIRTDDKGQKFAYMPKSIGAEEDDLLVFKLVGLQKKNDKAPITIGENIVL